MLFLVQVERKKVQCGSKPLHATFKKCGASIRSEIYDYWVASFWHIIGDL